LLVLCRDFYNSIHPTNAPSKDITQDVNSDRTAQHRKKVKQWFLQPQKFCKEIESEQQKHPEMCIYHLSSSHPTETCHIKIDCDKRSSSKKQCAQSGLSVGQSTGQLHHITEEQFEDASDAIDNEEMVLASNDTNEAELLYFVRVSKHYLRLVNDDPSPTATPRHSVMFPVIADSGANYHMFKEPEFFEFITTAKGNVILGDGKTSLPIIGVGTVKCFLGDELVRIENVRYVPSLSESIYSIFQHIQQPQHGLESSFEGGLFLKFPTFTAPAIIGQNDIYIDFHPDPSLLSVGNNNYSSSTMSKNDSTTFCRKLNEFQDNLDHDSEYLDQLLFKLRHYYSTIQTKRRLNFDVPAGIRKTSQHQHTLAYSRQLTKMPSAGDENELPTVLDSSSIEQTLPTLDVQSDDHLQENTNLSSCTVRPLIICSIDKPSLSLPRTVTVSEDYLRASVSFRKVDCMRQHFKDLYQDTVRIDNLPADAVLDPGDYATLHKKKSFHCSCTKTILFWRGNSYGHCLWS